MYFVSHELITRLRTKIMNFWLQDLCTSLSLSSLPSLSLFTNYHQLSAPFTLNRVHSGVTPVLGRKSQPVFIRKVPCSLSSGYYSIAGANRLDL